MRLPPVGCRLVMRFPPGDAVSVPGKLLEFCGATTAGTHRTWSQFPSILDRTDLPTQSSYALPSSRSGSIAACTVHQNRSGRAALQVSRSVRVPVFIEPDRAQGPTPLWGEIGRPLERRAQPRTKPREASSAWRSLRLHDEGEVDVVLRVGVRAVPLAMTTRVRSRVLETVRRRSMRSQVVAPRSVGSISRRGEIQAGLVARPEQWSAAPAYEVAPSAVASRDAAVSPRRGGRPSERATMRRPQGCNFGKCRPVRAVVCGSTAGRQPTRSTRRIVSTRPRRSDDRSQAGASRAEDPQPTRSRCEDALAAEEKPPASAGGRVDRLLRQPPPSPAPPRAEAEVLDVADLVGKAAARVRDRAPSSERSRVVSGRVPGGDAAS